jgi:hypothetical protein
MNSLNSTQRNGTRHNHTQQELLQKGRLSTVDLLIKLGCLVKRADNIFGVINS